MAISVQKPQSQKADARPISFLLDDRKSTGQTYTVDLVIRPEDLVRTDPSRMAIQQTLGGAWADNFGPGISTINISGHTGWRRRLGADDERDGGERFQYLFEVVFSKWHDLRNDAVRAGEDPDTVRLIFADALDGFAAVVAPNQFVLRRSKSRALLSQYQLALTVLTFDIDQPLGDQFGSNLRGSQSLQKSGLASLSASIDELTLYATDINAYITGSMVAPVRDFLVKTTRLYVDVREAIAAGDDIAATLIGLARMTAAAGANVFRTINALSSIPDQVRARLMQVANAYTNVFCVLRNALQQQEFYPDYNPLFGASNCSSTAGGRPLSPLSGVNPFYLFTPSNSTLPITLNEGAQSAMKSLASSDVPLAPIPLVSLTASLATISNGMEVA